MNPSYQETVFEICKKDPRYHSDAYFFLVEALDVTVKDIRKNQPDHGRHGPMAFTVFAEWGIHATLDFGEIVFNLVEAGRLGKTENDSREDFKNGYGFEEAFLRPFEPQQQEARTPPSRSTRRRKRG
jgi:hypothetical protein